MHIFSSSFNMYASQSTLWKLLIGKGQVILASCCSKFHCIRLKDNLGKQKKGYFFWMLASRQRNTWHVHSSDSSSHVFVTPPESRDKTRGLHLSSRLLDREVCGGGRGGVLGKEGATYHTAIAPLALECQGWKNGENVSERCWYVIIKYTYLRITIYVHFVFST